MTTKFIVDVMLKQCICIHTHGASYTHVYIMLHVYVYIYINSNKQLVHALIYFMFHTNTRPNVHSLPGGVFTVDVNTAFTAVGCEVRTFTVIL